MGAKKRKEVAGRQRVASTAYASTDCEGKRSAESSGMIPVEGAMVGWFGDDDG